MDWKKYLEEELKYYDENPDEDNDPIECHSNSSMSLDIDYSTSSWTVHLFSCISLHLLYFGWIVCIIKEYKWISLMSETVRTLTITEAEETALVEIIRYFNDMGLPENVDSDDYNSLTDKVCEPAFWEYN